MYINAPPVSVESGLEGEDESVPDRNGFVRVWEIYEEGGISPNRLLGRRFVKLNSHYGETSQTLLHSHPDSISTMFMQSKPPLRLFLLALTITLTCAQSVGATKLNAKPLPKAVEINVPGPKDFENDGAASAPVPSRFKRRPDYREVEAQQKLDDERKAKDAVEAKKQAELAAEQSEKKRHQQYQKYKVEAIEFNNQGVALGSQGKWTEAIIMHEKAVQYDPSHKQYKLNLSAARTAFGEKKMKDGDWQSAASLYRKALAAAHDNAQAAKGLSSALEKCGYDPVNIDVRVNLGDQLVNSGDLEGAYIEYKQALEIDPSSANALVKLGDLQYRCGQIAGAQSCYQQAAIKDPSYGPAQRQLGIIKLLQKDETGAAALLRKAVILDDSDALAGQQLVEIWRRQVAKNPLNQDYHLGFAGALQLTGDYAGAESEYKKLEMLNASHPGLVDGRASLQKAYHHGRAEKHKKAAETLFSQGLKKEALAEISQAVMIEPRNARYQFLLGECLESAGDYKGAHQAYLTCVLIDPEKNKEAAARMKEMQSTGPAPAPQQHPMGGGNFGQPMQQQMPMRQISFPAQQPVGGGGMPHGMPQRMMPQGMAPQGMAQQGTRPMGMAPQGMAPQGMPPQNGMMSHGMPQNMGMAPHGHNMPMQPPQGGFAPNWPQQPKGVYEGAPAGMSAPPTAAGFRQPQNLSQNQVAFNAQPNAQAGAGGETRSIPQGNAGNPIYGGAPSPDNVSIPTNSGGNPETSQDPKLNEVTQAESRKDHMAAVAILREIVATDLENASVHHRLAVNLMASGRISEAVTEFRIASALKPGTKTYAEDLARALAIHKRSMMSHHDGTSNSEDAKGGSK